MLKNNFQFALRAFRRRSGYSLINVFGLATGMACCLLIAAYVHHELSFDRFHEKADRIYRLVQTQKFGAEQELAVMPGPVAPTLMESYPEIAEAVRVVAVDRTIRYRESAFFDQRMIVADSTFLDVFSFPLVLGDPNTALVAPNSIVLTASAARTYFGGEDPLGKSITIFRGSLSDEYTVTGLATDVPMSSHLRFDGIISITTEESFNPVPLQHWGTSMFATYVLLSQGADPTALEGKLDGFVERYIGP